MSMYTQSWETSMLSSNEALMQKKTTSYGSQSSFPNCQEAQPLLHGQKPLVPNQDIMSRWGLGLALFCAFLGSVKGLMVSSVDSLGPIQIFGFRTVGAVSFLLPVVIYCQHQFLFDSTTNMYLLIRSLLGNVAVAGYYYGFSYLPLADASLIFYTTPIYTMVIGCVFLREKCGLVETICLILSLAGVGFVCVPGLLSDQLEQVSLQTIQGITGCFIGAVAQALVLVVLRKLTHVPVVVVSFWWAVVGIVCLGMLAFSGSLRMWNCGTESVFVVLIAVLGFLSEIALVVALYLEEAGRVSVALTSEILWAFLLQAVVQNTLPTMWSIAGGICILCSVFLPNVCNSLSRRCRDRQES